MALPLIVKKLDEAPAEARPHYVQKDGFYILDGTPSEGWSIDKVDDLKRSVSSLSEKNRKATELLKSFEDGEGNLIDSAKAREALDKLGKMADWTPSEKVQQQIESLKSQMIEKHQREISAKSERERQLMEAVRDSLVTSTATAAMSKAKVNVDLLLPHVERAIRVEEIDGKFVPRVLDKDGKTVRLTAKQGSHDPMGVEEFVLSLKDRFPEAFPSTVKPGAGTAGSDTTAQPVADGSFTLTREQARDVDAYRRARAAADKAGQPLQITDA